MMYSLGEGEAVLFALCLFSGIISGLLFDIFKVIRKSFGEAGTFTDLCDGLFWSLYACFFVWWIFRVNDGELRWFVFGGIIMGSAVYFLVFSRFFVIVGVFLLGIIKKLLLLVIKILVFPICFIFKKMRVAAVITVSPLRKLNKKVRRIKRFIGTKLRIRRFCAKKI